MAQRELRRNASALERRLLLSCYFFASLRLKNINLFGAERTAIILLIFLRDFVVKSTSVVETLLPLTHRDSSNRISDNVRSTATHVKQVIHA
jgi:hypothetical protein